MCPCRCSRSNGSNGSNESMRAVTTLYLSNPFGLETFTAAVCPCQDLLFPHVQSSIYRLCKYSGIRVVVLHWKVYILDFSCISTYVAGNSSDTAKQATASCTLLDALCRGGDRSENRINSATINNANLCQVYTLRSRVKSGADMRKVCTRHMHDYDRRPGTAIRRGVGIIVCLDVKARCENLSSPHATCPDGLTPVK